MWTGLGDNTELFWAVLSHRRPDPSASSPPYRPRARSSGPPSPSRGARHRDPSASSPPNRPLVSGRGGAPGHRRPRAEPDAATRAPRPTQSPSRERPRQSSRPLRLHMPPPLQSAAASPTGLPPPPLPVPATAKEARLPADRHPHGRSHPLLARCGTSLLFSPSPFCVLTMLLGSARVKYR
jgi:hypothetical protein